jgi:hypothetical protein
LVYLKAESRFLWLATVAVRAYTMRWRRIRCRSLGITGRFCDATVGSVCCAGTGGVATGVQALEWANHGELLMLLATELYRRDHGTGPPAPEALVGPYLARLPEQ